MSGARGRREVYQKRSFLIFRNEVDAGRDRATRMPALPIVTCIGLRATHATYARAHKQHTHKKEQAQEQAQQQAQEQEQEGG